MHTLNGVDAVGLTERNHIPFNKPYVTGKELDYISLAIQSAQLSGNGGFTKRCHEHLESLVGCTKALLTHSATAALEMSALLMDLSPGDEVIMPSFTFVSTANAFVLRGAVPVFIDISPDTLNIDERLIGKAITSRTKAIVPVHYAGVPCEMDSICATAKEHNLYVVEDAAHAIKSTLNGRYAGSFGHLAALSFHETKNIISGEGGALLINDPKLVERAHILWEKGTNRKQFFSGQVDKYTWVDQGSSFLPSEIIAAFLLAQLEAAEELTKSRLAIWDEYHRLLKPLEHLGLITRPKLPAGCEHNAHMYYLLVKDAQERTQMLEYLNANNVNAVFHYVPLHDSPAGRKFGRYSGTMGYTENISARLVRMPFWIGLTSAQVKTVVDHIFDFYSVEKRS